MAKSRPKADKTVCARRVSEVHTIILEGARFADICQYVSEHAKDAESAWFVPDGQEPLCERSIRRYQELAYQEIYADHERSRKKLRRMHLAKRRHVYARAVTTGDLATAARTLKDEAELCGIYPARKVAPISIEVLIRKADEELRGMTDEQLAGIVQPVITGDTGQTGKAGDRAAETPEG